jgi:hypothetical protein
MFVRPNFVTLLTVVEFPRPRGEVNPVIVSGVYFNAEAASCSKVSIRIFYGISKRSQSRTYNDLISVVRQEDGGFVCIGK